MRKLSEILEGLFDVDWSSGAETYSKFNHYISSIKGGKNQIMHGYDTYSFKPEDFTFEDIEETIKEKVIKKISKKQVREGCCYVDFTKTGMYLLDCRNIQSELWGKSARGITVVISNERNHIKLTICKTRDASWSILPDTTRTLYEIPAEMFEIITK